MFNNLLNNCMYKVNNPSKNFIKTKKMSNIFPIVINKISGVRTIQLIKSNKLFNKELLLLGELHNIVIPCSECKKNCLEIFDIFEYVKSSLYPNKLNVYIEDTYKPNEINKFNNNDYELNISRLPYLHNIYKHLYDTYNPNENLILHAVDIRKTIILNNNYTNMFSILNNFIMLNIVYDVEYLSELINNDKIQINNEKDEFYLNTFYNDVKNLYANLTENNLIICNDILNNSDTLNIIFKITKQKNKFLESYSNENNFNDYVLFSNILEQQINNNFINNNCYDYLLKVKEYLKSINNIIDKNKYVYEFLINFHKIHDFEIINKIKDILCSYMDHYTIYRMFRKFDNDEQNNIIFFGGSVHSTNIFNILKNTNYFNVLINKNNDIDCYEL